MIADPLVTHQHNSTDGPISFGIQSFSGSKTVRSATGGPVAALGLKDNITISHVDDPKTKRRRSLFRVDMDYIRDSESGTTDTVTSYIVLDFHPSSAGVNQTSATMKAFARLLTLITAGTSTALLDEGGTIPVGTVMASFLRGEP